MRPLAVFFFILLTCNIFYTDAKRFQGFLFPEELQTLFNLVYSILPPTKIGSDNRFGIGFRVGRNIDAQILVELGPQSDTQPLGESVRSSTPGKRDSEYTQAARSAGQTSRLPAESLGSKQSTLEDDVALSTETLKIPKSPRIPSGSAELSANPINDTKIKPKTLAGVDIDIKSQDTQQETELKLADGPTVKTLDNRPKKRKSKRRKLPKPKSSSTKTPERSVQKRSEPIFDMFVKWLTRFNRPREENIQNNLIRK